MDLNIDVNNLRSQVCKNAHDMKIFDAILDMLTEIKPSSTLVPVDESPLIALKRKLMAEHIEHLVGRLMRNHDVGLTKLIIIRWFYTQKLLHEVHEVSEDPLLPFSQAQNIGLWHELSKDGVPVEKIKRIENLLHQMIQSSKGYLGGYLNELNVKTNRVLISYDGDIVDLTYGKYSISISKQAFDKLLGEYRKDLEKGRDLPTIALEGTKTEYKRSRSPKIPRTGTLGHLDKQELMYNRIFNVICRYQALYAPGYHASIPQKVFDILREHLHVSHEIFASPFNHTLDNYTSAYPDTDRYFGSKGNFFQVYPGLFKDGGSFEANPPFLEEHMTALALIIINSLNRGGVALSFVVIVPAWIDTVLYHIFMRSEYNVIPEKYVALGRHEHYYRNGAHCFNASDAMRKSNNKTLIFILQNKLGSEKFMVTAEMLVGLKESFCML